MYSNLIIGILLIESLLYVNGQYGNGTNANANPNPNEDIESQIKIYIGAGCIGILTLLVFYVIITTQLKRHKKIKFIC